MAKKTDYGKFKNESDYYLIGKLKISLDKQNHYVVPHFNYATQRNDCCKLCVKKSLKEQKKLEPQWVLFWNVCEDKDPQYCCVSGRYIPPMYRGTKAVKPYSNGHYAWKSEFDRHISSKNVSDRTDSNSMLICVAKNPKKKIVPRVPRTKVRNTPEDITKFMKKFYPNLLKLHHDDFKTIRKNYFLKPNCKPFPGVKFN